MLAFIGVPGVYFHSLYGSRNFNAGVDETGHYRTINREKLDADAVLKALEDSDSIRSTVYHAYTHLLDIRKSEPAFHPLGQQQVLNLDRRVFALERTYQDARIIALHNVTGETFIVELEVGESRWNDRVHNTNHQANKGRLRLQLAPYQIVWLAESIE